MPALYESGRRRYSGGGLGLILRSMLDAIQRKDEPGVMKRWSLRRINVDAVFFVILEDYKVVELSGTDSFHATYGE
ncbi:hypothetical protein GCM10007171_08820 [Dickeya fangzhongdai]|nr:hypothetical protein GCM10007171_08820 [Dickeya fangzhongdai]